VLHYYAYTSRVQFDSYSYLSIIDVSSVVRGYEYATHLETVGVILVAEC